MKLLTKISIALWMIFTSAGTLEGQLANCLNDEEIITEIPPYRNRTGSFQVTLTGNVLSRPPHQLSEGDQVRVYVPATRALAPAVKVRRVSPFRPVGTLNIAGAAALARDDVPRNLELALREPDCLLVVTLADFAPGRGEIAISVLHAENNALKETQLGTFDFAVNNLYIGGFSLGPVRTDLRDESFAVASNGTNSVVTQTEIGRPILYSLFYTPYIWGRRDLEQIRFDAAQPWKHINPSFGIVLNDVRSNGLGALTIDLPAGFYLHYGVHIGKVTRINPESGIAVGDTVPSTLTSVPTIERWRTDDFYALSLDLRAALKFFQAATNTSLPR